jgi:CRISPR-associated endonuclease/helicase Cas3
MALASVADWIASDPVLLPYGRDASDPRRYFDEARELARQALDALGWHERRPLAGPSVRFSEVFPFLPNPVQRAVADALDAIREPALLLIEAPTGSGKTEAALFAHLALSARFGHRGLYVALPTQATGNGLLPRVRGFLERLGDRPLDLQLQHGAAWLHPLYRELEPRDVGEPDDENAGAEPRVLARSWFSPRKRAMLSEYGVGTVDQALLGALRVRHHFVRLWGLGNRTVVFDEVHAYDAYTSGLIEVLLRWLRALGSSVVLLSATLPAAKRHAFLEAFGATAPHHTPAYPRLVVVQGSTSRSHSVPWSEGQRYELEPAPRPVEELARLLFGRLSGPGCVACIVNTVDRAQRLYRAFGPGQTLRLQEIWPAAGVVGHSAALADLPVGKIVGETAVLIFHARYPGEERQAREDLVLALFGAAGERPRRAILIATQVLEQSLDVDFDLMVTDLAPVDLVLQRAGRLHRHTRPRPNPLERARLLIAGLGEDPPDLESEAWAHVYEPYALLASWWVLRGRAHVRIPADLDSLIEPVYGEVPLVGLVERLGARAQAAWSAWRRRLREQQDRARAIALNDPDRLLSLPATGVGYAVDQLELDDDEESPETQALLTRLGDPSIMVVPLHRTATGLALDPEGRQPARLAGPPTTEEARRLYARAVRLGRREVFRALSGLPVPAGWREHPVLRRLRPLALVDGRADIGGVEVRLDPTLGVVYARDPSSRAEGE